jgi:hypothetical protein
VKTRNLIAGMALLCFSFAGAPQRQSAPIFPQIEGWKLTVEEKAYTPDNLWDVIDGAADLFLEYHFLDLHIARYEQSANLEIKVELYKHASSEDAFGMYSQERYADYHFIALGVQGYMEKGVLNFLSGPYYVKLSTIQSGKEAQDALLMVGKKIEENLHQPRTRPDLVSAFPSGGKRVNSEQYIAKNFLGYSFLNAVYVVSYDDPSPFKAFLIQRDSAGQSSKTIAEYFATIPTGAVTRLTGDRFTVRDPHSGRIDFVQDGRFIYGVYGGEREKDRWPFLAEFGKILSGLK